MNKHLLKTRLASIAHYNTELEKLSAAKEATSNTRKELIRSLAEFCPFRKGHVLISGTQIRLVEKVGAISESYNKPNEFSYVLEVSFPNGDSWRSGNNLYIPFSEVDEWKIVNQKEVELLNEKEVAS
jgi:hypothetical protein